MDVKQYYKKIYETEVGIADKYPVVISLETADGGKAGVLTEVPRAVAAKLIVEGRALLATAAQKDEYMQQQLLAKQLAEKAELARRLQVAIISDTDLKGPVAAKKNIEHSGNTK